jgi:5-methylcytosine-specific restriction protein B
MQDSNRVAVGWHDLGDISWVDGKAETKEKLKKRLSKVYPNDPRTIGRDASQIEQFVAVINEGDIVLAADGMKILGIGKVVGGYEFKKELEFPHQRKVQWLTTSRWQMPKSNEGLQSTVRELGKSNENLLAIERQIQSQSEAPKKETVKITGRSVRLNGTAGRIQSVLDRKSQVVLYGPPGTGKTFWAERTANDLAALSTFGKLFEELNESDKEAINGIDGETGLVRLCCFHPAYGYEDFIEGYRPRTINGNISFDLRDGVFKKLCKDAAASPERNFYLIVDEINRGDIPRIFGELLTTLEKDKRGKRIVLPVSQEVFSVPKNVFLIGTMNTADRSISLIDAALRRRFGWVELMPDSTVLKDSSVAGIALKAWLDALNTRIREHVGRDARNLQIGHSYLMQGGTPIRDLATLKRAIRDDILPLLEEYCYEDFEALSNILGDQLVDLQAESIRHELFEEGQEDAFVQGILAPFADITTSSEAISSDDSRTIADDDEVGDDT